MADLYMSAAVEWSPPVAVGFLRINNYMRVTDSIVWVGEDADDDDGDDTFQVGLDWYHGGRSQLMIKEPTE